MNPNIFALWRYRALDIRALMIFLIITFVIYFHASIYELLVWLFESLAHSYLIQHMNSIGLGVGACFH